MHLINFKHNDKANFNKFYIKSCASRGPTCFVIGKKFFSADPRSRSFFYAPQSTTTQQILRNSLTQVRELGKGWALTGITIFI